MGTDPSVPNLPIFVMVWFMGFSATFNNISAISWRSVLLVEESGIPAENHWHAASHWQPWSHNVVSGTPHLSGIRTHNIDSCNFNYHTTTMTHVIKTIRCLLSFLEHFFSCNHVRVFIFNRPISNEPTKSCKSSKVPKPTTHQELLLLSKSTSKLKIIHVCIYGHEHVE